MLYIRHTLEKLRQAVTRSPVTLVLGPRQIGKTTLVKQLAQEKTMAYATFDDIRLLMAVKQDPLSFLELQTPPAIFDEIQRAPELFLPLKKIVDEQRTAGMFVLTGSANPLLSPRIADSLAGRMQILHLWPLSQGELRNRKEQFIDLAFAPTFTPPTPEPCSRDQLITLLIKGGYPTMQTLDSDDAVQDWCSSYITTLLQRDVQDLATIEGLASLPNLLALLATRTANLLNVAELSRSSGLPSSTLNRYLVLLEALFLINRQPAWHSNLSKRLVKAPKLYFVDTGIASFLLHASSQRLQHDHHLIGALLENFVISELIKQITWCTQRVTSYHFRTQAGAEVDMVLENHHGQVVGIEVKASQSIGPDDFKGLKQLQEEAGTRFVRGIVLYTGNLILPIGPNLFALPISSLWS